MTIQAVILTFNEAEFIGACVDSIAPLTTNILVLDSGSTDATVEIALARGARVEAHRWRGYATARNTGMQLAQPADWILFVDADERIPPNLRQEIQACVESETTASGFWIPRRNVICGRIMRATGWRPDYQLRLLRSGHCRFNEDQQVHEEAECDGETPVLTHSIVHLTYKGWLEFARKQFDYTRIATYDGRRPPVSSYLRAPWHAFRYRMVTLRGYRDGYVGLMASLLLSLSEIYRVHLARRSSQ